MADCCSTPVGNLGLTNCVVNPKYAVHRIWTYQFADDGTPNKIPAGQALNTAYAVSMLNHVDPSKRWYIQKNIVNADWAVRAEDVTQTYDDGTLAFIKEGVAAISYIVRSVATVYGGKLKSFRCKKIAEYVIDKAGTFWGYKQDSTGDLYPIQIQDESLSVGATYPTATTEYSTPVKYNWAQDVVDEKVAYYSNTINWTSTTVASLVDVNVAISNEATTGVTLTLTADYGAVDGPRPIVGLVVADFVSSITAATSRIRNVTDTSDVTITSATETADGVYNLAWTAQTSADILQPFAKKNGYDFTRLLEADIVIP